MVAHRAEKRKRCLLVIALWLETGKNVEENGRLADPWSAALQSFEVDARFIKNPR